VKPLGSVKCPANGLLVLALIVDAAPVTVEPMIRLRDAGRAKGP